MCPAGRLFKVLFSIQQFETASTKCCPMNMLILLLILQCKLFVLF